MHGAVRAAAIFLCLSALASILDAQPRVDPRNTYERILAVLPVIGTGTPDDPIRPMFIPARGDAAAAAAGTDALSRPSAILGYTFVLSDDGKFALTEIVTRDRAALQAIAATPSVQAFIKGVSKREDAIAVFKQFKKDFDIDKFGVMVR